MLVLWPWFPLDESVHYRWIQLFAFGLTIDMNCTHLESSLRLLRGSRPISIFHALTLRRACKLAALWPAQTVTGTCPMDSSCRFLLRNLHCYSSRCPWTGWFTLTLRHHRSTIWLRETPIRNQVGSTSCRTCLMRSTYPLHHACRGILAISWKAYPSNRPSSLLLSPDWRKMGLLILVNHSLLEVEHSLYYSLIASISPWTS